MVAVTGAVRERLTPADRRRDLAPGPMVSPTRRHRRWAETPVVPSWHHRGMRSQQFLQAGPVASAPVRCGREMADVTTIRHIGTELGPTVFNVRTADSIAALVGQISFRPVSRDLKGGRRYFRAVRRSADGLARGANASRYSAGAVSGAAMSGSM